MDTLPFLQVFIPVSLQLQPTMLSIFVKWLHNTILQMKENYSQDFPENAITFVDIVTKLLKIEGNCFISNEVENLTVLTDGLKQLNILKNDFRIVLPLQDYLKVFFLYSNSFVYLRFPGFETFH